MSLGLSSLVEIFSLEFSQFKFCIGVPTGVYSEIVESERTSAESSEAPAIIIAFRVPPPAIEIGAKF
jgi:hypothetical protein